MYILDPLPKGHYIYRSLALRDINILFSTNNIIEGKRIYRRAYFVLTKDNILVRDSEDYYKGILLVFSIEISSL